MDKKTFVIVGAGKGLGNAVAKEFAKTFSTIPFLKPLCIDKSAMNAACIVLHDTLKDKGIFVGSILVSGVIDPQDERYAPNLIAKEYWKMYETKSEYQVQY